MFDFAKFKLELILGLVLMGFIGYFVWNYNHKDVVIDKLKTAVVAQKIENTGLKDQVQDQKVDASINETVNTQVATETRQLESKVTAIQKKTDTKIAQIEKRHDQQPATPENTAAEDAETSAALIDGMWETYCSAQPDGSGCGATSPPANHST